MRDKIDFNNLTYSFKGQTTSINFCKFGGPMYIYGHIKNGDTTSQQVEKHQKDFKKEINDITSGNPKHLSKMQLYAIQILKIFVIQDKKIIDLLNGNSKIRSEATYKSKQNKTEGKGVKLLTPKQMLQRLPIALAQVKASNNSKSLLNEIRQIPYSLYQSKQITKKVYNNIIKSR